MWGLDPVVFGPYGPRPLELADHPAACVAQCRPLGYLVGQAPPGVSML